MFADIIDLFRSELWRWYIVENVNLSFKMHYLLVYLYRNKCRQTRGRCEGEGNLEMSDNYVDEASNNTNNSDEYVLYVLNKYLTLQWLCLLQFVHKYLRSFLFVTISISSGKVSDDVAKMLYLLDHNSNKMWLYPSRTNLSNLLEYIWLWAHISTPPHGLHTSRAPGENKIRFHSHNFLHESTWFIPGTLSCLDVDSGCLQWWCLPSSWSTDERTLSDLLQDDMSAKQWCPWCLSRLRTWQRWNLHWEDKLSTWTCPGLS